MENPVCVSLEFTPNPDTLKYSVNRVLCPIGRKTFTSIDETREVSPMAELLMAVQGVSAVMIGKDFVTITKSPEGQWDKVHQAVSESIEKHLSAGKPVFTEAALREITGIQERKFEGGDGATLDRIRTILETEIRPAILADGGDISLEGFREGIVYVELHGACVGCPSSTATLRMGVEARLRAAVPEVRGVST